MGNLIKKKEYLLAIAIIALYLLIICAFFYVTNERVKEEKTIRKEVEEIFRGIDDENWKNMPK
jgi:hypothetical protein